MSYWFPEAQQDQRHWPPVSSPFRLLGKRPAQPYYILPEAQVNAVSTEEYKFFDIKTPMPLSDIAAYVSFVNVAVAVSQDGRVYTAGFVNRSESNPGNALGTGSDFSSASNERSPKDRNYFQRPYNPIAEYATTRFVRCGLSGGVAPAAIDSSAFCSYLLSESGKVWAAGNIARCQTDDASAFSLEPSGNLPYFTPRDNAFYTNAAGQTLSQSDLVFTDISLRPDDNYYQSPQTTGGPYFRFLLITSDGKMLSRGDIFSRDNLQGQWYDTSSFLDSVVVNDGGSYPGVFGFAIQVSPPDHPNGIRATCAPVVQSGAIVSVNIANPGWGYTSPPTFTITTTGPPPVRQASLSAQLFSGQWRKAVQYADEVYALTQTGALYRAPFFSPFFRKVPGSFVGGYTDIALSRRNAQLPYWAAVRTDGRVDSDIDETGELSSNPNNISTLSITGVKQCAGRDGTRGMFCLITDDGELFKFGVLTPLQRMPTSARFSKLFATAGYVYANRIEELDALGNRLNALSPIRYGFFA